MGIVTMSLSFLMLLAIVIILFYIKKKLAELIVQIEEKVDIVKYAMQNPGETIRTVGAAVAANALEEVVKRVKNKKKE